MIFLLCLRVGCQVISGELLIVSPGFLVYRPRLVFPSALGPAAAIGFLLMPYWPLIFVSPSLPPTLFGVYLTHNSLLEAPCVV